MAYRNEVVVCRPRVPHRFCVGMSCARRVYGDESDRVSVRSVEKYQKARKNGNFIKHKIGDKIPLKEEIK